jgi:hypothetical protein
MPTTWLAIARRSGWVSESAIIAGSEGAVFDGMIYPYGRGIRIDIPGRLDILRRA